MGFNGLLKNLLNHIKKMIKHCKIITNKMSEKRHRQHNKYNGTGTSKGSTTSTGISGPDKSTVRVLCWDNLFSGAGGPWAPL